MYIDEITPESGTLFYFDCYDFLDQIEETSKLRSFFKGTLRLGITHLVLPIFAEIGILWNISIGLIKIPVYLSMRKYQTEIFADQIKAHFAYALLDFLSYKSWHYSPLSQYLPAYQDWHKLHYYMVLGFTFFPYKFREVSQTIRETVYPEPSKPLIDPRLLDKPLHY